MPNHNDPTLKLYLREIGRYPLLNHGEELALGKIIATSSGAIWQKAVNDLITANLRLVVSVAKRYAGKAIPMIDLIQDGAIGLRTAAIRYDYTLGYKFSTYAHWWIKQAITRSIDYYGRMIRLPIHRSEKLRKIKKQTGLLTQQLGRSPSRSEVAAVVGLSIDEVEKRGHESQPCISYDIPVGNGEATLQDIAVGAESGAEDAIYLDQTRQVLGGFLAALPDRDRRILIMRHGLNGDDPMTYQAIANVLDISREAACQAGARADRKIKCPGNKQIAQKFYTGKFSYA